MLRVFTPLSLLAMLTVACGSPPAADEAPKKSDIKGLISVDVKVGDGDEATVGREVLVHYAGELIPPNSILIFDVELVDVK